MRSDRWRKPIAGMLGLASVFLGACAQPQDPEKALAFAGIYARESKDNARDTVEAYNAAARNGSCHAAKRLGEIYDRGLISIPRNSVESLKWYHAASVLGCDIPTSTPAPRIADDAPRYSRTPQSSTQQFQMAEAFEAEGKRAQAIQAYIRLARGGSCEAARRLGEIYDQGLIGVGRDYAESLKWFGFARALGTCEVPMPGTGKR